MGLFSSASENSFLGIDIGDSSLKMVELVKKNKKIILNNYGFSENLTKTKFTAMEDPQSLAKIINKVKSDIGISCNRVTVSLPSFTVFSSVINLYNINKKNIAEYVNDEARKVIPIPLEEMSLAWEPISHSKNDATPNNNTKIFLTGSPKKLVRKYINIVQSAKMELVNLETETFSLIRSLLGDDKTTTMIVDLGANSTDICIVKESIPYLNRSINVCGSSITEAISQKLGLAFEKAEQLKYDLGVATVNGSETEVPTIILNAIAPIINEIKYMLDLFRSSNNESVEKIILTGGGALLINLANHLENALNVRVVVGDPWFRVSCPPELRPVLAEVGPRMAVAVGLALRSIK